MTHQLVDMEREVEGGDSSTGRRVLALDEGADGFEHPGAGDCDYAVEREVGKRGEK